MRSIEETRESRSSGSRSGTPLSFHDQLLILDMLQRAAHRRTHGRLMMASRRVLLILPLAAILSAPTCTESGPPKSNSGGPVTLPPAGPVAADYAATARYGCQDINHPSDHDPIYCDIQGHSPKSCEDARQGALDSAAQRPEVCQYCDFSHKVDLTVRASGKSSWIGTTSCP